MLSEAWHPGEGPTLLVALAWHEVVPGVLVLVPKVQGRRQELDAPGGGAAAAAAAVAAAVDTGAAGGAGGAAGAADGLSSLLAITPP